MAFPETERVIYEANPLDEVICQLRFPPILRIDTEVPAQFQERVRAALPFYRNKPAVQFGAGMPPELAAIFAKEAPFFGAGQTSHEFSSTGREWTLGLTREFVALNCKRYERWEQFKERLAGPMEALLEVYSPPLFTRIGLRYKNVIKRSAIGLSGVPWNELLRPWVAGPHSSADVAGEIEHSVIQTTIRLRDDRGRVFVNSGAVKDKADEECFLIDADFFSDTPTEPSHVVEQLDYLHGECGQFFRWCISDRLHDALRPARLAVS